MNHTQGNFTGTIDELLAHTAKVTNEVLENDVAVENEIEKIMDATGMTRFEVRQALQEEHLAEVRSTFESLCEKGVLMTTGFDPATNEPTYDFTDFGKMIWSKR